MGALKDEAEKLGIEVDGRWSNSTLERKIAEVKFNQAQDKARATDPDAKVTVRLLKHHRPGGWYKVLGHYDADENFVEGVMAPAPVPGAGFNHKLWANTVVQLPAADAKRLVENIATLVVTDRDPETKRAIGRREMRTRKPLAEVQIEWDGKVEYAA